MKHALGVQLTPELELGALALSDARLRLISARGAGAGGRARRRAGRLEYQGDDEPAGMFKEQSTVVAGNDAYASGRLTNVGPSLSEWSRKPLLDEGFGTRNPTGPDANAGLLDDQWLAALLETGYFGAAKLERPQGHRFLVVSVVAFGFSLLVLSSFVRISLPRPFCPSS